MTANVGDELLKALREALEIKQGRRKAPRVSRYKITARTNGARNVAPPPHYSAEDVRQIRARMGMSQAVFARAIGKSSDTIKAWEQGRRDPDGSARRLLELADRFPREFSLLVGLDA